MYTLYLKQFFLEFTYNNKVIPLHNYENCLFSQNAKTNLKDKSH